MAGPTDIKFNRSANDIAIGIANVYTRAREVIDESSEKLAALTHQVANTTDTFKGAVEADFDVVVAEGTFDSNAEAKEGWDELQSCDAALQSAKAAVEQLCAKFGLP